MFGGERLLAIAGLARAEQKKVNILERPGPCIREEAQRWSSGKPQTPHKTPHRSLATCDHRGLIIIGPHENYRRSLQVICSTRKSIEPSHGFSSVRSADFSANKPLNAPHRFFS